MNITYHRDGANNYMVLEAAQEIRGDEYQVRMMLVNPIPGLLRCRLRCVDGTASFHYEITSRQPAARIFEQRPIGSEDIRALVMGISRVLGGLEKYLLEDECLLLDPELIYMDVETREMFFCYLPFYKGDLPESFRGLAEYLLKHLDHEDGQAVLWGYQLYSGTASENYSIHEVLKKLRHRMGKEEIQAKKQQSGDFGEETDTGKDRDSRSEQSERQEGRLRGGSSGRERERIGKGLSEREKEMPKGIQKQIPGENLSGREVEMALSGRDISEGRKEKTRKSDVHRERSVLVFIKKKCSKKRIMASASFLLLSGTVGALAFLQILTLTQSGGILFLAAVVFLYLCTGRENQEKRKREKENGKKTVRIRKRTGKTKRKKEHLEENLQKDCCGEFIYREETQNRYNEDTEEQSVCDFCEEFDELQSLGDGKSISGISQNTEPEKTDEGETYGQTVLLQDGGVGEYPTLTGIHPAAQERVVLDRERFFIGKLRGQVDLVISSPGVSRIHAGIEKRGDHYYLADFNSTNGTFLNGERLMANEYRQLQTGDEIFFAETGYYYRE